MSKLWRRERNNNKEKGGEGRKEECTKWVETLKLKGVEASGTEIGIPGRRKKGINSKESWGREKNNEGSGSTGNGRDGKKGWK